MNVLQKLRDSTKVGKAAAPIKIVGPYADGIVHTIDRLKNNAGYISLVDVVAAQAYGDKNFNRKKLGELSKVAHDNNKLVGVSGINEWEVTAKSNNVFKGPKDPKTGKDTATKVKKDKNATKKNPALKAKNQNNPPATEALRTGYDMYIAGMAVPRFLFVNGTATDTLKAW